MKKAGVREKGVGELASGVTPWSVAVWLQFLPLGADDKNKCVKGRDCGVLGQLISVN